MYLTHLSLTDFRIFSRLDQDIPRNALILLGDNAQGKTSLLEAVYLLSTLDSLQASQSGELINFSARDKDLAVGRIVGDYRKGDRDHQIEIRIIQDTNNSGSPYVRKEVLLDGQKEQINAVVGHFNAVLFLPHMLRMITGSPRGRRRYLNLTIAQADPSYNLNLSEYNKAISQRNALLKQLQDRGGDPDQLAYWDELVTRHGSYLIHARIQFLKELEREAAAVHHELTRGQEVLRLAYQPAYEPLPHPPRQMGLPMEDPVDRSGLALEDIQNGFRERILELREEELNRGVTTIGPHRDDMLFLSNGINLGTFGSRGQVRTTLLALKMAEVAWIREKNGHWPVLLLDEVLAELDETRRQDLLQRLAQTEQSLLTTTDLSLFTPSFRDTAQLWQIKKGRLETA